ncbi:hypothetical protein DPMN_137695 [Dreissena polymorpha]|uniref:Uncharacterized protein n=1 Tax=Dreissena polymorpha TaxID=45954 RepID=A0A9D4JJ29_DREPO|nr:hypothetical protein DPMN_137695 [Dreissena polymorpha]
MRYHDQGVGPGRGQQASGGGDYCVHRDGHRPPWTDDHRHVQYKDQGRGRQQTLPVADPLRVLRDRGFHFRYAGSGDLNRQ